MCVRYFGRLPRRRWRDPRGYPPCHFHAAYHMGTWWLSFSLLLCHNLCYYSGYEKWGSITELGAVGKLNTIWLNIGSLIIHSDVSFHSMWTHGFVLLCFTESDDDDEDEDEDEDEEIDVVTVVAADKVQANNSRNSRERPVLPATPSASAQVAAMHNYTAAAPKSPKSDSGSSSHSSSSSSRSSHSQKRSRSYHIHDHSTPLKRAKISVAHSSELRSAMRRYRHQHCRTSNNNNRCSSDSEDSDCKRAQHNVLERKRRNDLKSSFHILRDHVPDLQSQERAAKVTILKKATDHIMFLRRQQQSLNVELDRHQRTNEALQRRLRLLRSK